MNDRAAPKGILFVTENGTTRQQLHTELGLDSGTCRHRARIWQAAGVWGRLHHTVRERLGQEGLPDRSRSPPDSMSIRANGVRTDRGKRGTKYHLPVTAHRLPLAMPIAAANRHDSMPMQPIMDGLAPVKGPGPVRPRPGKLPADTACGFRPVRPYLRRRGITARIARVGVDSSERLVRHGGVVDRTMS